jgi:predicted ATP-dependent endonuclease of OLD family
MSQRDHLGLSCILGGNGVGKSAYVDAVRFILSHGASQLRLHKAEQLMLPYPSKSELQRSRGTATSVQTRHFGKLLLRLSSLSQKAQTPS